MNKIKLLTVAGSFLLTTQMALASGFQLGEHSSAGLGRAFAGEAAIAEDASAGNRNPASMTRFNRPVFSGGVILVTPYIDISGKSPSGRSLDASNVAPNEMIPNLHFIYPINEQWILGSSLTSNYGLSTEFNENYTAGSLAGRTKLTTGNLNVSSAYRFNPHFSVGAGFNAVYAKAKIVRYLGEINIGLPLPTNTEVAHLKGDKWGYGWNAGLMYEINDNHRFGLSYRSKVDINFNGDFRDDLTTRGKFIDGKLTLTLPEIWELSGYHRVDPQWAVHYSLSYTGWDKFKELRAEGNTGNQLFYKNEDFSDTYRLALGTTYYYNDNWTFRTGVAYDKRASKNLPSISIPDQDRIWFSLGTTYAFNQDASVDLGFTYMKGKSVTFKEEIKSGGPSYEFNAKGEAFIYGINFNYAF